MLENEVDTLDYIGELVEHHRLDVDFWRGQKLEGKPWARTVYADHVVKVSDESVDAVMAVWERYLAARTKSIRFKCAPMHWELITDPKEAERVGCVTALVWVRTDWADFPDTHRKGHHSGSGGDESPAQAYHIVAQARSRIHICSGRLALVDAGTPSIAGRWSLDGRLRGPRRDTRQRGRPRDERVHQSHYPKIDRY